MNEPEDDTLTAVGHLTPLEKDLVALLQTRGVVGEQDLAFVVKRVRTTLRIVQLGQTLGRPLTQKERGKVHRKLQDGQSVEAVFAWLQSKSARSPAG